MHKKLSHAGRIGKLPTWAETRYLHKSPKDPGGGGEGQGQTLIMLVWWLCCKLKLLMGE